LSEVGSGLIKLAYRGVAGFFVFLFLFIFGVLGIALGFAGGLIIGISWIPIAFPEILTEIPIMVIGNQNVTDPVLATMIMLFVGCILLAVGFFFIVLTYMIGKGAITIDRELAGIVDKAFSGSGKTDRLTRLERLAALRDSGALSDKEFEYEKALILESKE
jgi:hypothetical protein